MRETAPISKEELKKRNLSVVCPHCHSDIIAEPVSDPVNEYNDDSYFVARCPNHKNYGRYCKPFFTIYQALNDCISDRYPVPIYEESNYHESIPLSIRKDYAEATKCLGIGAYKGAVALCRRVIEAICHDKAHDQIVHEKDVKLWSLIDILKAGGLITENLRITAHEIRYMGNYGAHFQNDGLNEVEREDARQIREFTWLLLNELYITPHKTAEMIKKRVEKKSKNH